MSKVTDKSVPFFNLLINITILSVLLCAVLVGVYIALDMHYVFNHAYADDLTSDDNEADFKRKIADISDECIAWLTVENSELNYPVMFSSSNRIKYLNTAPNGDYNLAGSIFLDYRNSPDFSDGYSIIYGHHMENDAMFGILDKFQDSTYFNEHRIGHLYLRNGSCLNIYFFAFAQINIENDDVLNPTSNIDIEKFISENALLTYEHERGKTIALSTCQGADDKERILVFGILLDKEQKTGGISE